MKLKEKTKPSEKDTTEPYHRKTERLTWEETVEFLSPFSCTGHALDIGAGGIGVEMHEKLAVDNLVELKILDGHLLVQGRVRWVHRQVSGSYRVGIQFDHEDLSILTHIRNLLRK